MKRFVALIALMLSLDACFAAGKETRCFELRTYTAMPGRLDDLLARFREHTMALFAKHDIATMGYWVPLTNTENKLVYMLAYPSREAHDKSWKEFSADPDWQAVVKASEANGRLVARVDSVFLAATDYSPVVQPTRTEHPRVYELRTYHAATGKLDDLNTRFRDHTTALFARHGMGQFGYWVPTDEKDGAGRTLIYILIHQTREAGDESFRAFRADPEWIKVKADSEAHGPLTTRVESLLMVPTDFSPAK